MSAAVSHSRRCTCKENAVVLTQAREIEGEIKVVLPNQGEVAQCAPVGVNVSPAVNGGWRITYIVKCKNI